LRHPCTSFIFIYTYIQDDFSIETEVPGKDGDDATIVREAACETLLMCIATALNHGLRNGGGIGDVLRHVGQAEDLFVTRIFYDMAFFTVRL
jgi:hypothetical protein